MSWFALNHSIHHPRIWRQQNVLKGHGNQTGHCIAKRNKMQALGLEARLDVWLAGYFLSLVNLLNKHCWAYTLCQVPRWVSGMWDWQTIPATTELSDEWSLPGFSAQDIPPSSKELHAVFKRTSWLKESMSVGQGSLTFTKTLQFPIDQKQPFRD